MLSRRVREPRYDIARRPDHNEAQKHIRPQLPMDAAPNQQLLVVQQGDIQAVEHCRVVQRCRGAEHWRKLLRPGQTQRVFPRT